MGDIEQSIYDDIDFDFVGRDVTAVPRPTQGGGTVTWCYVNKTWVFVEPPNWGDWKAGDHMPEQWSII